MNGHDEYLELLAASIDFGLTEEEVARLNYHLASCPECRRAATDLRGQNAVFATTPIAPLAPARSEHILRAALRKPATKPRWGMLAVAALLATLGGGVLFAGVQLITDDDPAPDQSPPIVAEVSAPPSDVPAEESVDPGAPPVDEPPVTPNPGDDEPPPPADPAKLAFPLPYSPEVAPIRLAPLPDGRVWVSFQVDEDTVLALLDDTGAGEPLVVPSAQDCVPLAVADGGLRLSCSHIVAPDECIDTCEVEDRVYAWNANGQQLDGSPVTLPPGTFSAGLNGQMARVVGDQLIQVRAEGSDEAVAEFGEFGSARLLTVGPDGSIREGIPVSLPIKCCVIGPDGVAYGTNVDSSDDGTQTTQIVAFDANGMRSGWPITLEGDASGPSFGPGGRLILSSWIDGGSRILNLNPDGTEALAPIDVNGSVEWSPEYDGPLSPLVDERGRSWVVADRAIHGFEPGGAPLPGFPYEPETGFIQQGGGCGPEDTGCQSWTAPPRMAPRGLVYTLESAPSGQGDRITVVNPDGSVRSGWPKTLQREGATWDSVTIGENRRAYAVAIEPEPNNESSISVLAFAPNGTREWIRVLAEP